MKLALFEPLQSLLARLDSAVITVQQQAQASGPSSYWTIEGMESYRFSIGIFFFMLIGVTVFAAIVFRFFLSSKASGGLKFGEKLLFLMIVAGMFVAVGFGALQLLYGRLF
ncbi:MAG: hypothetical protein LBV36_06795 [Chromatiales bacterium]|jgi:hypothetical protein|nr:hypothetical protein [Chromatiales bacterium]